MERKSSLVKKVNPDRGDIDLSLKQVSNDQKNKTQRSKKIWKRKTLLQNLKEKAKLSDSDIEKLEDGLYLNMILFMMHFLKLEEMELIQ